MRTIRPVVLRVTVKTRGSRCASEMLGIEVMPGRLDSSLRFIDIKTLCLEKPSAL